MAEKWIQGMHMEKGALHRELHVKEGERIPADKMEKAEHSKDPHIRKQVALAETLSRFHK